MLKHILAPALLLEAIVIAGIVAVAIFFAGIAIDPSPRTCVAGSIAAALTDCEVHQ